MNKYVNPNATTIGGEGMAWNEGTQIDKQIEFNHYGIFSNDNTYAITFNPYINRPPTKYLQQQTTKPPHTNQRITKINVEPPSSLTDGNQYIVNDKVNNPPLLPPYLQKPENLGEIQGISQKQ